MLSKAHLTSHSRMSGSRWVIAPLWLSGWWRSLRGCDQVWTCHTGCHILSCLEKGNAKEYSNYCTIALISHTSKVMLKIIQVRLQQYMNRELPDVKAGFRKGRGTRNQIAKARWIIKKAKWLSGEALQIAVKRREVESKERNPKERKCKRMLKLPHNCIHLTR